MSKKSYFSNPLDLAVNTITETDIERLTDWLRSYPRLTMADETRRFESAWAKWLGVKYSVMCNSGSSANLLMYAALDALKRTKNRKVVVPATGWVTTVAPAIQLGFSPIMCESDGQTFCTDLAALEGLLKKHKPSAVIVVHTLGVPNDMTTLLQLQKKYGFMLMEDCCASHGSLHQGRKVGTFGLMSSFSFYYGHHMSSIEGGVVCTDDEEVYYLLLMLRSHGWCKDLPKKEYDRIARKYKIDTFHHPFTFVNLGYNLRPTDLSAYVGSIQLERLDDTVRKRIDNHLLYQQLLKGKLDFARPVPGDVVSSISFCAVAESSEHRKRLVRKLEKHNIDTRIFTAGNLGRHPFWFERYGTFKGPVADRLYSRGFFLPNNQTLTRDEIEFICQTVAPS
jgi:CDP-6-deoxy-D-xylo-4-hexulose-3-dehydrase